MFNWAGPHSSTASDLDVTFNPGIELTLDDGAPGQVQAITVQTDGKVIVGGSFHRVNGTPHYCLARLNADGSLDQNFAGSLDVIDGLVGQVFALAPQTDGKLIVAGQSTANGAHTWPD